MPLIRGGTVVKDEWRAVADDEPLPKGKSCIISLARLLREAGSFTDAAKDAGLGVHLACDEDPNELKPYLSFLALVTVRLETFRDGRAFSQARILRSQLGFGGEIRATGHILRDQLLFLHRCGVNAVEVDSRVKGEDWQAALKEFSYVYQPAADDAEPVSALRQKTPDRR